MRLLDPVSARLFPSLARYARRAKLLLLLCSHTLLFLVGVAITFLFLGYHQHVATDNQNRLIGRVVALEEQYQRDHKKELTFTKVQANDWAWAKVKKERQQ